MRNKVILRADAGPTIGYGHFTRSLALADMLSGTFDCTFYTYTPTFYQLNELSKVCDHVPLTGDHPNERFINSLQGDEIVVLDNYYFGTDYQKEVKNIGCKLVCISTLRDIVYFCDVLFSPDPYPIDSFLVQAYTNVYSGFEWAFLRRVFREKAEVCVQRESRNSIRHILVSLGGSDKYGVTKKILDLPGLRDLHIDVLIGDRTELSCPDTGRVFLYKNADAELIAELMIQADMGIFSASSICNEAMALGLPIAVGYYAENQRLYHDLLVDGGYACSIGSYLNDTCIGNIPSVIKSPCHLKKPSLDYVHQQSNVISIFKAL